MLEKLIALADNNRVVRVEGPNGSGKSTLLQHYQDHLESIGVGYGLLSQHDSVFDELTAKELFLIASAPQAEHLLAELAGISALDKRLAIMSSGERSKVLIALALCFEVVVLDEPLAHLDGWSRAKLEQLVLESKSRFVIANHEPGAFSGAALLHLDRYESH